MADTWGKKMRRVFVTLRRHAKTKKKRLQTFRAVPTTANHGLNIVHACQKGHESNDESRGAMT